MSHVTEDLTALLDGALPAARRAEVEAHLAGCQRCRDERERLAAVLARLAALPPPPEPSPWFAARLEARLARAGGPSAGLLARLAAWRWRLGLPLGALGALAALALVVARHHRDDELAAAAARLELLEEYETIASVGDVETAEDAAVVAALDRLEPREGRP